jgi:radical SAM superfamily enzyme YgiQ (UPF0313 family)
MDCATEYRISIEMGGGGIKQAYRSLGEPTHRPVGITERTEVVMFTPDAGQAQKDEFFIPNLHNGLFRIGTFLSRSGVENCLVCTDIDDMDAAWEQIALFQPVIIGFSTYYNTMQKDLLNIQRARACTPNGLIVVGGFEASLNKQWMELYDLVDVIVMGEGEMPILALAEVIRRFRGATGPHSKEQLKQFIIDDFKKSQPAGICVLGSDCIIYHKPMDRMTHEFYQDINLNAFHDRMRESPVEDYWRLTNIMFDGTKDCYFRFISSDHCPWKCKFCQSSIFYSALTGKKQTAVRYLEPENIIKIIAKVSETYPYITHIYIDDENFLVNKLRALHTAELICQAKQQNIIREDIRFISRARTNNIDAGICAALKHAGWEMVSVGSESYSQDELDFMNKKTTVEVNKKGVQTILASGLKAAENYILFTPITTLDTFYETARGICRNIIELSVDSAATHFLTPLPGTELWGDGKFEVIQNNPYNAYLQQEKIRFRNSATGYEYLGRQIVVPGARMNLPHPEIMLPNDELVRKISLLTLAHLTQQVQYLKTFVRSKRVALSRQFVTLANLFSATCLALEQTREIRWDELRRIIIDGVKNLYA